MNVHVRPSEQIRLLTDDVMLLVEQEVKLARNEIDLKLNQMSTGLIVGIAGVLAAFVAFAVLVQAAIESLATLMPQWAAALAIGVATLVIAAVLLSMARDRLRPSSLAPHRTIDSVTRTAKTVKENFK